MVNIEWIVASALVGSVFGWLLHALFLSEAEKKAMSIRNRSASKLGLEARKEQDDRMLEAIASAMTMMKQGTAPAEALKLTAANYPDVAMKLAKKALKGELPKGLMGGMDDN